MAGNRRDRRRSPAVRAAIGRAARRDVRTVPALPDRTTRVAGHVRTRPRRGLSRGTRSHLRARHVDPRALREADRPAGPASGRHRCAHDPSGRPDDARFRMAGRRLRAVLSAARCRRGAAAPRAAAGKRHAHRLPESRDRRAAACERHHVGRDTGDNLRRARSRRAAACARRAARSGAAGASNHARRICAGAARRMAGALGRHAGIRVAVSRAARRWRDERHVLAARGARRADRDRFPRGGHERACCAIRMRAASCLQATRRPTSARCSVSSARERSRASGRRCRPMRPRTAPRTSADPARARRAPRIARRPIRPTATRSAAESVCRTANA